MTQISEELRRQMIAEAAYFRAERRGFSDGDAVADWLEAEEEIQMKLGNGEAGAVGLEERLAATNDRLRALRKRLAGMTSSARREWEDDIEKLAKYRDRLRKRVNEAREKSGHAAEKAKIKADELWEQISSHMESLSRRKSRHS
jgi:Protein of unknown function (DUF2934)